MNLGAQMIMVETKADMIWKKNKKITMDYKKNTSAIYVHEKWLYVF